MKLEEALPAIEKLVTQEQISWYAKVSGDHNPLHLDPEFASGTQFGGVIAHGMLTLAFVSEMLTLAFGKSWLDSGKLKVRFKGAAYPGDRLRTSGKVVKEEAGPNGQSVQCSVGLTNGRGEELITGTASLSMPSGST